MAIDGVGVAGNPVPQRLYDLLESNQIYRYPNQVVWGKFFIPVSALPEKYKSISESENRFVRSAYIPYVVSLNFAVRLISQCARTDQDLCIEYVERERLECRIWRPYSAWYTGLHPRPVISAKSHAFKPVTSIVCMAAFCYDHEMLGSLARHAHSVLSYNESLDAEKESKILASQFSVQKTNLSVIMVSSVCGINASSANELEWFYILLAYMFSEVGDIARALDPDPLPILREISCRLPSSRFQRPSVLQLHP